MFGFGKHAPDARCGLVLDVSSASVAVALVVAETDEPKPTVVWTHVERLPVAPEAPSVVDSAKRISAAVLQVAMEIQQHGLPTLAQHDKNLRVDTLQVSVAAPWSYTVPKDIAFKSETPFVVTESMLHDLITKAEQQVAETHGTNPIFDALGLEVLNTSTNQFTANGYVVTDPVGHKVTELTLVRLLTICQKQLLNSLEELHQQIVPRARKTTRSFVQLLGNELVSNLTTANVYGVIDISGNASEVGVVINQKLQSVINSTTGYYSAARALAKKTQEPVEAALSALRSGATVENSTSTEAVTAVRSSYSAHVADLIARASQIADAPSHFIVHCDTPWRSFVEQSVREALQSRGDTSATISFVSEKLVDTIQLDETRLALSVATFYREATE